MAAGRPPESESAVQHVRHEAMIGEHAEVADLVAWCKPNPGRMDHADRLVRELAPKAAPPGRYSPDRLEDVIAAERLDAVVITSPDFTHAGLVTRAMRAAPTWSSKNPSPPRLPAAATSR